MLARNVITGVAAAALVLTVACVGDDPAATNPPTSNDGGSSSSGSNGSPDPDAATCASPKTTCGTACVDLQTDDAHCGSCTTPCPGTKCSNGVCGGADLKQVSTGSTLSCAVRIDGSVYCWGRGQSSALGQPFSGTAGVPCNAANSRCQPTPTKVPNLEPVDSISVGHQNACVVTKKQEVWCWGRNHAGELGPLAGLPICDGTQQCVDKPTKIDGLPAGIAEVSLGLAHACARTTSGEVWCWGDNTYGRLGRGNLAASTGPAKVTALPVAAQISVSGDQFGHTCAVVKPDNVIWCWGYNVQLELGRTTGDVACPTGTGTVKCNPTPSLANATGLSAAMLQVVSGAGHTCARTQTNDVYCWGYHGYKAGTLAPTSPSATARKVDSNVKLLTGRYASPCVIHGDGTVACWGLSSDGRLGFIEPASKGACVAGVTWPCNDGQPTPILVQATAFGDSFDIGLVVRDDGKLFAWGGNNSGDLGVAPSAGPKQCFTFQGGGATTPCSNVPVEIVIP